VKSEKEEARHMYKFSLAKNIQNYQTNLRLDVERFELLLERPLNELEDIYFTLKEASLQNSRNIC